MTSPKPKKRGRGRPKTIENMREYKAAKQREYRARKRLPTPKKSKEVTNE